MEKYNIGIMEKTYSLDLSKSDVIKALIEGGVKLRRLRRLVLNWKEIEDNRMKEEPLSPKEEND